MIDLNIKPLHSVLVIHEAGHIVVGTFDSWDETANEMHIDDVVGLTFEQDQKGITAQPRVFNPFAADQFPFLAFRVDEISLMIGVKDELKKMCDDFRRQVETGIQVATSMPPGVPPRKGMS